MSPCTLTKVSLPLKEAGVPLNASIVAITIEIGNNILVQVNRKYMEQDTAHRSTEERWKLYTGLIIEELCNYEAKQHG